MAEFLTFTIVNVFAFSLVSIRISGLFIVAPVFGGEQIPIKMRVLLALCIAFAMYPGLSLSVQALPSSAVDYFFIVVKELCIGLLIGFLVTAILYGFQMGGRFMSIHMGLAMARMLDPFTNIQSSVIGELMGLFTLTVFLIMNGHHLILRAIYDSFSHIPPLTVTYRPAIFDEAIRTFNIVITTSFKVAAPTMAALFAINLIFGFISRLVPRMNVFILSLPVKIGVGVIIILVTFPAILYLFRNVINDVFQKIYLILGAL